MTITTSIMFRTTPAVLLVGVLAVAPPLTAQDQPQDYPLTCNLRTAKLTLTSNGFLMSFQGAEAGTDTRELADGECGWASRGWRQEEPMRLVWNAGEPLIAGVNLDRYNQAESLNLVTSASEGNRQAIQRVLDAWIAGGTLTLWVYRTGNLMTVTTITP